MPQKYRCIQLKIETYEKLCKMGNLKDSFDSVICDLLQKIDSIPYSNFNKEPIK